MSDVHAAQYVFGTLPFVRSPKGLEGQQHVASTPDALSAAEVQEMEPRLILASSPHRSAPAGKCVFFRLTSGRFVVAQVVSTDGAGLMERSGAYLAHALVFEEAALARLHFDPFVVLRAYRFHRSIDFLDGLGGSRDLPPAKLPPASRPAPAAMPDPDLLQLAMHAPAMRQSGRSLALVGEPMWTLGQLEALLGLLADETRRVCSFDSWCDGVQTGGLGYWAIGIPARRLAPLGAVVFEQEQRGVQIPVDLGGIAGVDAWTMEKVRAGEAVRPFDRSVAEALHSWLGAGTYATPPAALELALDDPDAQQVLRGLAGKHAGDLRRLARRRLRDDLGDRLAELVQADVDAALADDPLTCLRRVVRGFPPAELDASVCARALEAGWYRGRRADELRRYLESAVDRARSSPPPSAELLRLLVSLGDWPSLQLLHETPGAAEAVDAFVADLVRGLDVRVAHRFRETRGEVIVETSIRALDLHTGTDRTGLVNGLLVATAGDPWSGVGRGRIAWGRTGAGAVDWAHLRRLIDLLVERSRGAASR